MLILAVFIDNSIKYFIHVDPDFPLSLAINPPNTFTNTG